MTTIEIPSCDLLGVKSSGLEMALLMANLNSRSPIGTRYLPDQISLIEQAAGMKNLQRSAFIRYAVTQVAKQVVSGQR